MNLLKKYVAEFNNSFTDKLKYIEATAIVDQLPFRMNFSVKDGTIINSDEYEKEIENNAMLESGRYFTDKEYRNGEKVAICWDYLHWNTMSSPVSSRMAVDKNTLHIQGKDYKIIAYGIIDVDRPTIPVTSLEDTTLFHQRLVFHFKKPIRQEQYNLVVEKTNKILGDRAVVEPANLPDDDAVYLYNTIIMVTIFYYHCLGNKFCDFVSLYSFQQKTVTYGLPDLRNEFCESSIIVFGRMCGFDGTSLCYRCFVV